MKAYTVEETKAFVAEFIITPYQPGRLDNLTFAVKDCIDIKDTVTGFGNPRWQSTHSKAVTNAICVEQLLLADDILLCFPTAPDFAPLKGLFSGSPEQRTASTYSRDLIGINALASLAKLPQVTLPIDDNNPPPIGISFVARAYKDEVLLDLENLMHMKYAVSCLY